MANYIYVYIKYDLAVVKTHGSSTVEGEKAVKSVCAFFWPFFIELTFLLLPNGR